MRRSLPFALLVATVLALAPAAPPAQALRAHERPPSIPDRVEELQQELDSLIEDVDDLKGPVAEFDLFDECMYVIGVTQHGSANGPLGYLFGQGGQDRRPALALDIRGFAQPQFQFLAFPAEEPPSIECNEDAGQELTDE